MNNPFLERIGHGIMVREFSEWFLVTLPGQAFEYEIEKIEAGRPGQPEITDIDFVAETTAATIDVLDLMDAALREISNCDPFAHGPKMHGIACRALERIGAAAKSFRSSPRLSIGSVRIVEEPPVKNGAVFEEKSAAAAG